MASALVLAVLGWRLEASESYALVLAVLMASALVLAVLGWGLVTGGWRLEASESYMASALVLAVLCWWLVAGGWLIFIATGGCWLVPGVAWRLAADG